MILVFNIINLKLQPQLPGSNELTLLYNDQYDSKSAYNNFNNTLMFENNRFSPNFYFQYHAINLIGYNSKLVYILAWHRVGNESSHK